jgi:hypothetical protein
MQRIVIDLKHGKFLLIFTYEGIAFRALLF